MCVYRSLYVNGVDRPKKPDGDLTNIFCVSDSYYVHKIMEKIEKGGKYTYWDIPVRQGSCHEKVHIKLSKHFEMRRVVAKYMSHCLSKKCKSVIQGRQHPILSVPHSSELMSSSSFSLTMEPDKYCHTIKFWKISREVMFLMCLLTKGGLDQPCYIWGLWLPSNQCCQGTRKMAR